MQPELVIVPAIFVIPAVVITIKMWLTHKEKMASVTPLPERNLIMEDRLVRIEQAVEAIAVEMERIGEGQRFVTNLLSERAPALPSPTALQP